MRKISLAASAVVAVAVVAGCSSADPGGTALGTSQEQLGAGSDAYNPLPGHFPTKDRFAHELSKPGGGGGGGGAANLGYHGGGTITSSHIVACFWGSAWGSGSLATTLEGFVSSYGTTGEYNVITQYYNTTSGSTQYIQLGSGSKAWFDKSDPTSANVTDADVQGEASNCMTGTGGYDASAIYEVFLPDGYYSSDGSSTSCGGPNLKYCAYHGHFSATSGDVKYAAMPYPSCSGCQSSGFNDAQNFEHFISHETREAATDEDGSAWFDRRGYEADDKCAWSPSPFIDSTTGYAYQYEWSNKSGGCVQSM